VADRDGGVIRHQLCAQGQRAVVFVSVQAVPLFHRNQSDRRVEQSGRTLHEMYREFQGAGGRVLICPLCMKALGSGEGDLIAGA